MTQATLSGIRVLDFTRVLAGPFCTMLLGDMGADVIKVESHRGDDTRHWGPPWAGDDPETRLSAYYLSVNRNKRGIVLDLKSREGQEIARELAKQSHIVVENFKPGGLARFGLGYDDLHAINPALVYASISGFGQTGPYADHPGYDHAIQAMSGLMSITGAADGAPHKVGVAISDVVTGLFALSSILAALRHAEHTGEGQHLDISLLESQLSALVNIASNTLISGQAPVRHGNNHPNIVPYQVFNAADKAFVVAVGNDGQFRALCDLLARPELAHDPRYVSNELRVKNRDSLVSTLDDLFAQKHAADWLTLLLDAGIPSAPINTVPEILNDPHVRARGLIQEGTLPDGGTFEFVGNPVGFSATPTDVRISPPLLGQHTDVVLAELLGMNAEQIANLRAKGVI